MIQGLLYRGSYDLGFVSGAPYFLQFPGRAAGLSVEGYSHTPAIWAPGVGSRLASGEPRVEPSLGCKRRFASFAVWLSRALGVEC